MTRRKGTICNTHTGLICTTIDLKYGETIDIVEVKIGDPDIEELTNAARAIVCYPMAYTNDGTVKLLNRLREALKEAYYPDEPDQDLTTHPNTQ